MATIDELRARAELISEEQQIGGNTAERVGEAFDMVADIEEAIDERVQDLEGLVGGRAVTYDPQTPTSEEQAQARENINAQESIADIDEIRAGSEAGATAYQLPQGGIPEADMAADVQAALAKARTAYQKPSAGIPYADLNTALKNQITEANDNEVIGFRYAQGDIYFYKPLTDGSFGTTAYDATGIIVKHHHNIALYDITNNLFYFPLSFDVSGAVKRYKYFRLDSSITFGFIELIRQGATPITSAYVAADVPLYTKAQVDTILAGKQPTIADLDAIRAGAAEGATAYQKPTNGIPSTDMTQGVQDALQAAEDAAPQATTYTKTETDALLAQKQGTLTFDDAPSASSSNPVKSSGIYSALHGKQNSADIATINGEDITHGGNVVITGQTIVIDATPTAGSNNAVSSGGVKQYVDEHTDPSLFSGNVYSPKSQAVNLIKGKYVNKYGVLTSLSSGKIYVLDVSSVKAVILEYSAHSSNVNYGIIFTNDSDVSSVSSYIAPYTTTAGKKIIYVPEGVSYLAYSQGTITAVDDLTDELTDRIASLGSEFKTFKTPDITTASFVNGYLKSDGTIYSGNSWRTAFFPVVAGDIYYLEQQNLGTAYAFYGFSFDTTGNTIFSHVSANPQKLTAIVVPQHARYLVINFGGVTSTASYPSNIVNFGTPANDKSVSVYNYNPNYALNQKIKPCVSVFPWSFQNSEYTLGYDDNIGTYAIYSGSGQVLSALRISTKDLRGRFFDDKKIRIRMLIKSTSSFRVRLYAWGTTPYYIEDSALVSASSVWYEYDHIFDLTANNLGTLTSLDVSLAFASTSNHTVQIAQMIATDEVYSQAIKISSPFSKDDNNLTRLLPFIFSRCLYIGDSVSTANNYLWKSYIEDTYRIQYIRDISTLPPANGGIRVIPPVADESEIATANKSIWYRCAANRMSIYTFDFISLLGGFNDLNTYPSIGTTSDKPYVDDASTFATPANYTDVWTDSLTFAQCYMGCIEMLMRDFPGKEIVLATIYPTSEGTATDASTGFSRSESMAIIQCKIAYKYGLRCVPLYWLFSQNAIGAMTRDGVHPNNVLARQMAIKYSEVLEF